MDILVYIDEGAGPLAARLLMKTLEKLRLSSLGISSLCISSLVRTHSAALAETNWEESCDLLIFPGGRDIYYHQKLQGAVNARIRSFVEKGGAYLGLCAGGYYGCGSIEFEKGYPLEVIGQRELKFFPGLAKGSVYGPNRFQYENERGSCLAELTWEGDTSLSSISTYFHGGCAFIDPHLYPNTKVLARYQNLPETPAAIIECQVEKGKAILSGVHPEYSAPHLREMRSTPEDLMECLQKAEPVREQLFYNLLKRLKI